MIIKKIILILLFCLIAIAAIVLLGSILGGPDQMESIKLWSLQLQEWETKLLLWRASLITVLLLLWNKGVQWFVRYHCLDHSVSEQLIAIRFTVLYCYLFIEMVMIQQWPQHIMLSLTQ